MKIKAGSGLVVLAAACALRVAAQTAGGEQAPAQIILTASAPVQQLHGSLVREIDDPHTGDRWMLVVDANHPAGPGRMILVAAPLSGTPGSQMSNASMSAGPALAMPVIHTGDHLVVEENTAVVEARLEAVAMGPALKGSPLNARLSIGGNVVRVVAVGPGQAVFAPEAEARR
jgi:hypothetical protein